MSRRKTVSRLVLCRWTGGRSPVCIRRMRRRRWPATGARDIAAHPWARRACRFRALGVLSPGRGQRGIPARLVPGARKRNRQRPFYRKPRALRLPAGCGRSVESIWLARRPHSGRYARFAPIRRAHGRRQLCRVSCLGGDRQRQAHTVRRPLPAVPTSASSTAGSPRPPWPRPPVRRSFSPSSNASVNLSRARS